MDWDKHGKEKEQNISVYKERRLSVPVTPELHNVMDIFRAQYPDKEFSEVAIIKTFIEGGIKLWMAHIQALENQKAALSEDKAVSSEDRTVSPEQEDDLIYDDYETVSSDG